MKTIGLLGGMSWESSTDYYKIINQTIKKELDGVHSAKCVLYSVDFQEIESYQFSNQWDKSADLLAETCLAIKRAGADYIVICTNTMHKVADQIQAKLSIPILHIAKVTADVLKQQGIKKVSLLGPKFTIEENFYTSILEKENLEVVIPNEQNREKVSQIIYEELCLVKISEESQKFYLDTVQELRVSGAEGVILVCTDIGMLINQKVTTVPLFDTTEIHTTQAALLALEK